MSGEVMAALDGASAEHGLLPSQLVALGNLTAAMTAFERARDPGHTAQPLVLYPTAHGLAVWRVEPGRIDDEDSIPLGLVCCPCEDWWTFVPLAGLPPDLAAVVHAVTSVTPPEATP